VSALAGAVAPEASIPTGMTASLDISVLEQAKDVYFDTIMEMINTVEIPDFDKDKNHYMEGNSFVLHERNSDVHFLADVENNSLILRCENMSGEFINKSFKYKESWYVAKGHSEVDLHKIMIQVGLKFDTETLADGRVVPSIQSVDVQTHINRFNITIKMHGNFFTEMTGIFRILFEGPLSSAIDQAITE
jgi:hypothetical protein